MPVILTTEDGLPLLLDGTTSPLVLDATNVELREDGAYELREDGSLILRES
jgi:hypothetical protein